MKLNRLLRLSRLIVCSFLILSSISCDFTRMMRDSNRKQKVLEYKIDSLKTEYEKVNEELKLIENELKRRENLDSINKKTELIDSINE